MTVKKTKRRKGKAKTQVKRRRLRGPLGKINWRDPMVRLLTVMLLIMTIGTGLKGCFHGLSGQINIVLDAAYGGEQTGYAGLVNEADACQKIVDELKVLLENDTHFTVSCTHDSGYAASVEERAETIAVEKPDMVLSIHAGGSPDGKKSGMRIYADPPSAKTHEDSLKLADTICSQFTEDSWKPVVKYLYYEPTKDGVTDAEQVYALKIVDETDLNDYQLETWDMMEKCNVPVVIVNTFCVSNADDVAKWGTEEGYKKAAELYYKALKLTYGFGE